MNPTQKNPGAAATASGGRCRAPYKSRSNSTQIRARIQRQSRHLRDALNANLEDLLREILGTPAWTTQTQWRYGRHGSLSVSVSGTSRGAWYSHEHGVGGGPIELIQHQHGCANSDAVSWAHHWIRGRS
jgi:hypothetical protein